MAITCTTVPDLLDQSERAELLVEAAALRDGAERRDRPGWQVVDGTQFLGPAHYWFSAEGTVRPRVHAALAARIGERLSIAVHPVQSNYLYYGPGDSLGLHHDQARCPFALVTLLDGEAEPLCVHPELAGAAVEGLATLVSPGGHTGGGPVALQDGPLLLSGCAVPHHRDAHEGDVEITIATFCFGEGAA